MFETAEERASQSRFDFKIVNKAGRAGNPLRDSLRVTSKQMGIAGNVIERFKSESTRSGRQRYRLVVLVDSVNQAIRVRPAQGNEPTFAFTTNQVGVNNGYVTTGLPSGVKAAGLPQGTYQEVAPGVFQYLK